MSRWVQDGPIDRWEPGHVYVVDLWATWCGPCLHTMPVLTRLQKQYPKDLTVIGMNVWEMAPKRLPEFVRSHADSMRFAVAMDSIPPGKEANEGLTALTYVGNTQLVSIPKTVLIDRDGKVAWIGGPPDLEVPLQAVIAGTWDVKPFAEKYEAEQRLERKYLGVLKVVEDAINAAQWQKAFEASEVAAQADTSFPERVAGNGFGLLAMTILRDSTASAADKALAQRAAERSIALQSHPAWSIFDVAAQAAEAAGDREAARKHLAAAIERAEGDDLLKLQERLKKISPGE